MATERHPRASTVRGSLLWLGGAQGAAVLLQFAGSIAIARHLSLREAGIAAAALAVASALSLIQALGLQALLVREERLTPALIASAFTVNALLQLALAALTWAGGVLGAAWLGDPGVGDALRVLALTPLLGVPAFLPTALLEREGRFRALAVIGAAGTIAGAGLTIALVVRGTGFLSIAYGQWANVGVATVAALVLGREHARARFGLGEWRRIGAFGVQMLAVTGLNSLGARLSDLVLARLLGLPALGVYARASSLNTLLWTNVHLLVGRVMLVDFAAQHRAGAPLRARYVQTVAVATALLWPLFAGVAVLAGPIIEQLFGPSWRAAAAPLALLALASLIQVAVTMTWELFAATGRLAVQTRIEGARSVLALALFALGCLGGLAWAAAARVADAVFAVAVYRRHVEGMTGASLADLSPAYLQGAALTVLACAPPTGVMAAWRWRPDVPIAWAAGAVVLGALLWAGGLLAMRHPLLGAWRSGRADG